ncbi:MULTISPECIES: DUF3040 domain-containing protein [Actinoplanes]|uniref:DUF3040 domain-containing protein n=1 Tax=Actinoplanes TaxID=1865 RepID=UPI0005F2C852|nr:MULTISPECIES: DUF3040 domain-containing protein [Actinoplanes]GLY02119.1 hypothetical protein Acsp01_24980 [Actinoplanes sp. NBRC 101535]
MLDESEARALEDIERRLCSDPRFVRRMRGPGPLRPFPTVSVLCLTAFLALPFVALFGGPQAALIHADVAAVLVVTVLAWRHRRRAGS